MCSLHGNQFAHGVGGSVSLTQQSHDTSAHGTWKCARFMGAHFHLGPPRIRVHYVPRVVFATESRDAATVERFAPISVLRAGIQTGSLMCARI